jgi:hypothetical protein
MSYIFFEVATHKAALVDLVADLGLVVDGWTPFMGVRGDLELSTWCLGFEG